MVCINGIIGAIYVKHFKKREVPELKGKLTQEQAFEEEHRGKYGFPYTQKYKTNKKEE